MPYTNLRIGRYSASDMPSHITTVTKNRTPLFNAIDNAIGVRIRHYPITPNKILTALHHTTATDVSRREQCAMGAFDCIDAHSAQEAVDLLTPHGKRAQLFAAGADVLFMLKDAIEGSMEAPPDVLINLGKVQELAGIRYDPTTGLALGAMARLIDLIEHPIIQEQYNLLVQAASQVACAALPQTVNRVANLFGTATFCKRT